MKKLTNKKQLPDFECKQQSKTLNGKHLSSHKNQKTPNLTQINHKNRSLSHIEHFSNRSREQMC
ncbi:TetR family transcriptional regulator [Vibrio cholerae]|uniref:TetR family transcriptional regulator n=1 Tax=Vibrio cholerae TaxID=666 RepID=UPI0028EAEB7D|nr:TetR family transcriptional regulator [Vibrio cholerae]MED7817007.1 TetR family transcriptional regulator [Vibrio cholerae]